VFSYLLYRTISGSNHELTSVLVISWLLPDIVLYNKYETLVKSWLLPDIVLYNKYEALVKSWLLPDIVLYNKDETLVKSCCIEQYLVAVMI
jgi:hypothetical protein